MLLKPPPEVIWVILKFFWGHLHLVLSRSDRYPISKTHTEWPGVNRFGTSKGWIKNKDRIVITRMYYPFKILQLLKGLWGERRVIGAGKSRLRRWASISLVCVMSCHSNIDRSGLEISINLVSPRSLQDTRGWIRQSGTDKVMCEDESRSISYTFITERERNQGSWQSTEWHPKAIKPLFKFYILN